MKNKKLKTRTIIGIAILLLGVALLLENLGVFYISRYVPLFQWQSFFIILGLIIMLTSSVVAGLFLFFIGIIFLNPALWPVVFIIIGFNILYRSKRLRKGNLFSSDSQSNESNFEEIDEIAIFGGGDKSFYCKNFTGGKATAIFGGSDIDLSNCELSEEGAVIELISIFGGNTFTLRKDWDVVIDVVPLFGGFSDKRKKDPSIEIDNSKTLHIKGVVIFGGGEIKSN